MDYNKEKREIHLDRELSNLDKFVFSFIQILEKHVDYVVMSGYVSIILGRSRATEDVDAFIKRIDEKGFTELYQELTNAGFWCLNGESVGELYSYLEDGLAIRFAKGPAIPNLEIKYTKDKLDEETFENYITLILPGEKLKISSLEGQIAFKEEYLGDDKDMEDALHLREIFKGQLDNAKINKVKEAIKFVRKSNKNGKGKEI